MGLWGPPKSNSTQRPAENIRADLPWLLGMAILAAGTIAIYSRTFSVPLLHDDFWSITENPSIRKLWPALSPPDEAGVGGRPLLNLSYALNFAVGGTSVWGYHLVNTVVHMLASWTMFGLVRRTLLRPILVERFGTAAAPLALAVSAIWALHPVQTESVTYISQRAELLMGLFYLLTLYCFVRGGEADGRNARRTWFLCSTLSCLAGAATKEVIITAPLIVLLYDRTFMSGTFSGAWRRNWRLYLALAAALIPLGHRAIGLLRGGLVFGVGFGGGIAWWDYGLTECRVIVRYILLAFWPSPLVFDYGRCVPCRVSEAWPYALILASMLVATVVALRRSRALGFAASWFFLILAPSSSIVPLVGESMAENRLYLPLAGVVALTVLCGFALSGRRSLPLFAIAAAVLGISSVQRNRDYASELVIWSDTVAKNPGNARAHGNLGKVLARMPGRLNDAIAEYEVAERLDPTAPELRVNLGNIWFRVPGHLDDAVAQYQDALRLRPGDDQAHFDLACALARIPNRLNDSIAQYEEALRLRPDFIAAHFNLANALMEIPGRSNDAIAQYEEALRQKPDMAEAHFGLAMALLNLPGRTDEAIDHLKAVLRLQPTNGEAREKLSEMTAYQP
jgi:protein O-mannosyl-transferase